MTIRTIALAATATLFLGGVAFADGDTSGSAAGGNVNPSTAIQKGRSSASDNNLNPAGGAPGIQGPAGAENGATLNKDNSKSNPSNMASPE